MPRYLIYAAREEEFDAGYVWLNNPAFPPRTPIELRNTETNWKTFCESRHLEGNFVDGYDQRPRTAKIRDTTTNEIPSHVLVISEWYRDALGGFQTSAHRNGAPTPIEVRKLRIRGLRNLRIAAHHPDFAVRIGLALGLLGTWLAIVGIAAWMLDHLLGSDNKGSMSDLAAIAVVAGLLCWWPYRGPRRPPLVRRDQPPRVPDQLPRREEGSAMIVLAAIALAAGLLCWWPYRGARRPHTVRRDHLPTGRRPGPA